MSIFRDFFVKEKPVFTGISRGMGGFGFGSGPTGPSVPTVGPIQGSGGSKVTSGSNVYHIFTHPNSDNFVVSGGSGNIELLVVAGGGGGGNHHGGGGGAGGILHHPSLAVLPGTYLVTVGGGGAGALVGPGTGNGTATYGASGENSYFGPPSTPNGFTADGGGGAFPGGRAGNTGTQPLVYQNAPPTSNPYQGAGLPGGSGGGTADEVANPGGASTQNPMNGATGYGNAGGSSTSAPTYVAGGGGGAGGAGNPGSTPVNGAGGNGRPFSNFPAPVLAPGVPSPMRTNWSAAVTVPGLFGGGGGRGGQTPAPTGGPGGSGGGGAGANGSNPGTKGGDGVAGTGGGAGGGSGAFSGGGGDGGSGIVILKYSSS